MALEPKKYDVLVIDDSDIARLSMTRALSGAGYAALELPSPIGATRSIIRHRVSLVVIDVNMPSIRGDKLAALFRANKRLAHLKVILVSGTETMHLDELAAAVGADGVVAKQEGTPALVATVRKLLGRAK